MRELVADRNLVAFCGLYCGACGAYLHQRCPGCREKTNASWCKVRGCCMDKGHLTCADCAEPCAPSECRKFNNVISKVFGLIFRSDRAACIALIRGVGLDAFADEMALRRVQSLPHKMSVRKG